MFFEITVDGAIINGAIMDQDETTFTVMFCLNNDEQNGNCTSTTVNVTNHSYANGLDEITMIVLEMDSQAPISFEDLHFTSGQTTIQLNYCLANGCYMIGALSDTPIVMNDDVTITVTANGQSVVIDAFQEEEEGEGFGLMVGINSNCVITDEPCEADFSYQTTSTPGEFHFNNESVMVDGIQWYWEFGDGHSSASMNPTHQYHVEGAYEVCLTSYTEECSSIYCTTVYVNGVECTDNLVNFTLNSDVLSGGSNQLMYSVIDVESGQHLATGVADFTEVYQSYTYEVCLPNGCYALMVYNNNPINLGEGTDVNISLGDLSLMNTTTTEQQNDFSFSVYFKLFSDCTVGIDEIQAVPSFIMHPNPASTQLVIQSSNKASISQLEILDTKGTLLQSVQPNQTTYTQSVDQLATGVYFARVITGNGVEVLRFQVMH